MGIVVCELEFSISKNGILGLHQFWYLYWYRPIPAFFDGIGISQVCYTGTLFLYIINHEILLYYASNTVIR